MGRTWWALLLASTILGSSVVALAQDHGTVAEQLDKGRRMLSGARLAATDKFQRMGQLSPEQTAAIDGIISDASNIWTACIISQIDHSSASTDPSVSVVNRAMNNCRPDRDEMVAWIRFAGHVHRDEMPAPTLADFVQKQDTWQRGKALERLAKARSSR